MTGSAPEGRAWASPDDTRRIQALASRRLARDWPAPRLHPGDLDWWAVHAWGRGPALPDRVRVWSRGDETLAFAWYTPPGSLDLLVDPAVTAADARGIATDAVAWGADRRDRFASEPTAPVLAWATASSSVEADALAALGLEPRVDEDPFVQLTGTLGPGATASASTLADGIVIRPITDEDVEARVVSSRAAFPASTMTPERYRRTFDALTYRPELDLIAVDDAGAVTAFALGWLDPATEVVELEPVGVHPERQGRGLGLAICRTVIERARDLGAVRAMISTNDSNRAAIGLYQRLGLTLTNRIVPYAAVPDEARPT